MTNDGLTNIVSGLGTAKTKRFHNIWALNDMGAYQQLEAAYQSNWIAAQIVDVPAQDMTREWRAIKSSRAEDIEALEQSLCVPTLVQESLSWSRLFGGAAILMLTNQDLEQPLRPERIGKGDLKRLLVFDRWELSAMELNTWDVLSANFLRPEYYTVSGSSQRIHWSHFVHFYGVKLPRRLYRMNQGWGDSALRRCLSDVADMVAAKDGIAELMQESNVDIVTRQGLTNELASDQDDAIIERYSLFSQMKSLVNMALLDENETFDRKTLNLGGVAPILDNLMVWISGASRIPMTKLFGTSAKGLNATGEGDLKTYYDDIRAAQSYELVIPMRTLDNVLVRSAVGTMPSDYDYEWNPLSQPNQLESEQAGVLRAQRDQIYLDMGVVQRSQIMRNLQSNEDYQFDDDSIKQLEELEDPTVFDEQFNVDQ